VWLADEDEEFVSVEKVEDAYFIKTSPHPFRPNRRIYRSDRWYDSKKARTEVIGNHRTSRIDEEERNVKIDHPAKFMRLLNPASRADLIDRKISRKDKKYSETYYERMKKRQKNLEASIATTTTTTVSCRSSVEDAQPVDASSCTENKATDESAKRGISRYASTEKSSTLLQKIYERSRRKKRPAPKMPSKIQRSSGAFDGNFEEKVGRESKRSRSNVDSRGNKSDCQTFQRNFRKKV